MTTAEIPPDATADAVAGQASAAAREERLEVGAAALAGSRARSIIFNQHFLVAVAATLMTGGIAVILLGWHGASGSILVSEQIPYVISGGLLGVALAIIGALTFFTHWLTVLVRENRRQHSELVKTIQDEREQDRQQLLEVIRALQAPKTTGNARARSGR
jgi:hypothetical protein